MEYKIERSSNGKTVLDIMSKELGISKATIKHLKFLENGIRLNGAHVTVRRTVSEGDVLSLSIEDTCSPPKLSPSDLSLKIAYEDEDIVVPDKSSDMPTHQSFGHYGDTVANALAFRYSQMGIPFVFRPVNRLDRNTSGLLLIARNRISAASLSLAMKEGKIKKRYIAILKGKLENDSGVIDTYMRRTAKSIIVREVCDECEGADRAITEYEVLFKNDSHTLVYAAPITGRTHQLRVHFTHLGCPIEGDDMYGDESALITRHALHSFSLTFPKGESELTITSPLPEDMRRLAIAVFGYKIYDAESDVIKLILPRTKDTDYAE